MKSSTGKSQASGTRHLWLTGLLLLAAGCGGPEATLQGIVSLDGTPLDHGTVSLVPTGGGTGASATIQADGTYVARTSSEDGLAAGTYAVTVRALSENRPDPNGGPPMPGKLLTPPKYGQSATSGLQVVVESGANTHDIQLSSN